jgi:hypothetical protein
MEDDKKKNGITRLRFLKDSGVMAAGFTLFHTTGIGKGTVNKLENNLFIDGMTGHQLVIPKEASDIESRAAQQLQHYLAEMSKTKPNITRENDFKGTAAIYIGKTAYAKEKGIDTDKLQADGYLLRPSGNNFIIAGGTGKGTLYGAYAVLESLGFRKYTSAYTLVPKTKGISFPKKEVVDVPFIQYRSTSYRDTREPEYADWHRLSSRDTWGLFVHTFDRLVPPDEYAAAHPEYYSLRNGTRQPGTQLCLSNEGVLDAVITHLEKEIDKNPEALYWSVSQNDNDQHCECDRCKALDEKYGSVPSGSILYFVNKVAKAFPGKTISTLAYWYSRSAPVGIKAEPNVNIMLCNIESKRQQPVFKTDPAFTNDLKDWGKIAGNIIIWDYNIQFANLVSPFPNLHTIKPNIKFYTDNHVNSLFMQANGQAGGEMAGLRAYLICKLMWNPDADDAAIIDDYLKGYYGAAGTYIRQYIDEMRESLLKSNFPLSIFGDPIDAKDTYLSPVMMEKYKQLFDKAEKAVANDGEVLRRVQAARLPIMYAEIQIGRQEIDTERSLYKTADNGRVIAKPEMVAMLQEFVKRCKEDGVTRLRERSTPPDDYLQSYNRMFTKMEQMQKTLSFRKKITPVTLPAKSSVGVEGLTDGVFGSYESWSNPDVHWVGYEGTHIDFVLDLEEVMQVNGISMDFLNAQAQPDWNLLALPKHVSYALSEDDKTYGEPITIDNPHNPNPKENPDIASVPVFSFHADVNKRARYIRVHAESLLKMPAWHIRTGMPAWLYCDEIVVT